MRPEARREFEDAVRAAWEAYRVLTQIVLEDTSRIVAELRHLTPRAADKRKKKVAREAEKKAIELARYVIPIAAFTSMVHTLSGIVLHRLNRMMHTGDAPAEAATIPSSKAARAGSESPSGTNAAISSRRTKRWLDCSEL